MVHRQTEAKKKMEESARDIDQNFTRSCYLPQLIVRSTLQSTKSYKPHSHPQLSVGLIEEGVTCLTMNGAETVLAPGSIVLIEPDRVHSCNPVGGKPRSYHMLYLDHEWCCQVLSATHGFKVGSYRIGNPVIEESDSCAELISMLRSMADDGSQELAAKIEAVLFELINLYCSPEQEADRESEFIAEVKRRLLNDLLSPPTLESIAAGLGRSKESVIRSFKRREGITPKSFLNNYRIEKAKMMLAKGMSIVDVANEVGYSDQSQFHRAFVAYTASTPRQYQRVTFRQ